MITWQIYERITAIKSRIWWVAKRNTWVENTDSWFYKGLL